MARLSVWEESESGHTNNKLTLLLFLGFLLKDRLISLALKLGLRLCFFLRSRKTTKRAMQAKSISSNTFVNL